MSHARTSTRTASRGCATAASSRMRCARRAKSRAATASSIGARASSSRGRRGRGTRATRSRASPTAPTWPKLQIDGLGLFLGTLRRRGTPRWDEAAALVRTWLEAHWCEPCSTGGKSARECTRQRSGASATASTRTRSAARRTRVPRTASTPRSSSSARPRSSSGREHPARRWRRCTMPPRRHLLRGRAVAPPHGHVRPGKPERAADCLAWIEAHARPNGDLPEQAQGRLLHPESYEPWLERWGEPASPLLWSHAMYLRLHHALRDRR